MGVYINMEMPRWCEECPCMSEVDVVQGTACGCKLTMKIREIDNDKRPTWCPLVPVPPHGRLIDGDVAEAIHFTSEAADGKDFYDGILFAADFISQQPTIIEAEEGEI